MEFQPTPVPEGWRPPADAVTFQITPDPDPPPMQVGDRVTWMDPDGVAELVVMEAEPWEDEDGCPGQSIRFGPA